jgi:antitoxin HicB
MPQEGRQMAESQSSSNTALAAAGISKSELAQRVGKDEKETRRILDPRHPTKLPALTASLRALGKRLVVGVMQQTA